jgi:hypothetical protein
MTKIEQKSNEQPGIVITLDKILAVRPPLFLFSCNPTDINIYKYKYIVLTLQQQGRFPNSFLCNNRETGRVQSNKIFRGQTFIAKPKHL